MLATTLPPFLFLVTRGLTGWCSYRVSPLLYHTFAQGFLGPLSTSSPLLGFIGQHSCYANHFFISFLGLPQPIYFFFTSFILLGFLLDLLGFLGLITTSLPLITSWVYWPFSLSNKFTNSFPKLLWLIYFPFTSYYSYGRKLHSLGFFGPFTPALPLFILVGLLAISPTISTRWDCFLIPLLFFFPTFFYIVGLLPLLGPLSKVGINNI